MESSIIRLLLFDDYHDCDYGSDNKGILAGRGGAGDAGIGNDGKANNCGAEFIGLLFKWKRQAKERMTRMGVWAQAIFPTAKR